MGLKDAKVQIVIVGLLAFCCPGIFNALNGLGGAGGSSESAAAAANLPLYLTFAVFGYFGGAFFNLFGNRVLMFVGGMCYGVYCIGLYFASKSEGLIWMAVVAGIILGFGAGLFWTAQGAMMMAYATPSNKGQYIAIFWGIFNLGAMLGGFLSFGINYNDRNSKEADPTTYFVFVALMIAGSIGGLFCLARPSSVVREDGVICKFEKAQSVIQEVKGALSVALNPYMLFLITPFLASNWFYTYQFNGYNLQNFNVRTRGFNSAFYWGAQMLGAWTLGKLLDKPGWSVKKRAFVGLAVLAAEFNIAHALGAIVQFSYGGGFERGRACFSGREIVINKETGLRESYTMDFLESGRYALPFIVYVLYGIGDAMVQTYAYWVMAGVANDDMNLLTRFAGFYKGVQSLGGAAAWALDVFKVKYVPQFWICWALVLLSTPFFYLVARDIKEPEMKTLDRISDSNATIEGGPYNGGANDVHLPVKA